MLTHLPPEIEALFNQAEKHQDISKYGCWKRQFGTRGRQDMGRVRKHQSKAQKLKSKANHIFLKNFGGYLECPD